jgi:transcriptional regulator with GAF, ATPase, and Fis domain
MKQDKSTDDDLFKGTIARLERNIIVSALEQTGGNQTKAAMRLGTTKRILSYRVRKYGIELGKLCRRNNGNTRQKA